MPAVGRRGFTLTELMIALLLMGLVTGALYRILVTSQRLFWEQAQRVQLNDNLRTATAVLSSELRQLSTRDPLGSDLIAISDSSIIYKAMRSLYLTCASPHAPTVLHLDPALLGHRRLDPARDSLLVFLDGDPAQALDDQWVHADVAHLASGMACPGGGPSLDVTVTPGLPDGVGEGLPVRGFELVEIRRYRDGSGSTWLGGRTHHKRTGWHSLQAIAGPLAPDGLQFSYFDADGHPTADLTRVSRIGITVIARGAGPYGDRTDTLWTHVALRNNQ